MRPAGTHQLVLSLVRRDEGDAVLNPLVREGPHRSVNLAILLDDPT